jgi:hypothetical protein
VEQRAVELDQSSGRWPALLPPVCFFLIQGRYTPYISLPLCRKHPLRSR